MALIEQIIYSKSFASDPAFRDTTFSIRPLPPMNGCPLGLYDSKTGRITLSPDSTEAVLVHELGHRHGDYYHRNLSEKYAEDFRRRYQMNNRTLLYQGDDLGRLPQFGSLFEEGERGAVEILLERTLSPSELQTIRDRLQSYTRPGETLPRIVYGNGADPFLRVEFAQGIDWTIAIALVMSGVVVGTIVAVGVAVYKTAEEMPWIVPLGLFGIVSAFGLREVYKRKYKR